MFKKRAIQKDCIKKSTEAAPATNDSDETLNNVVATQNSHKKPKNAMFIEKNDNEDKDDGFRVTYESERKLNIGNNQRATATIDYDTEVGQDHRSILERNAEIGKKILSGELAEDVYRGLGAVRPVLNIREGAIAAGKSTGRYGPVRGNQHVRMTMRVDLNPEICKDYKETGYCGFGDTCIFLHDRSDYKPGWIIEKEWEEEQKRVQEKAAKKLRKMDRNTRKQAGEPVSSSSNDSDSDSSDSSSSPEDSIPKICQICKEEWKLSMNPVVTLCHHYFCETCALQHYTKTSICAACKEGTQGVFNSATIIINQLKESK